MNDFTKEELQEIKRCLKYMINGGITPYSSLTMKLNKKIQSMIDNYCDHGISGATKDGQKFCADKIIIKGTSGGGGGCASGGSGSPGSLMDYTIWEENK